MLEFSQSDRHTTATPSKLDGHEIEFLLWMLTNDATQAQPGNGATLDWSEVTRLAGPSLIPILAHRIEERELAAEPPQSVRKMLRKSLLHATGQYLERKSVFRTAIRALNTAGVQPIVLKGMALAHTVYPTPAIRPMSDLDLWIDGNRFQEALEAMHAGGFRLPREQRGRLGATFSHGRFTLLGLPRLHTTVDLLETPESLFDQPTDTVLAMSAGAQPLDVDGISFRVLAPEHQLLHVCVHMSRKHQFWTGLMPLVDIQLLINHPTLDLDWTRVVRSSGGPGLSPWMYVPLSLAKDLLGARVPDHVLQTTPYRTELDLVIPSARQLTLEPTHPPVPRFWRAGTTPNSTTIATSMANRIWGHYITRNEIATRGILLAVNTSLDRIRSDLFVKLPRYFKAWLRDRDGTKSRRGRLNHARLGNEVHQRLATIDAARTRPVV